MVDVFPTNEIVILIYALMYLLKIIICMLILVYLACVMIGVEARARQ